MALSVSLFAVVLRHSSQNELIRLPAAENNYRCVGTQLLTTDSGFISDAYDMLTVYSISSVNPPTTNTFAYESAREGANCTWIIRPAGGLVGPNDERNLRFTFQRFALQDGLEFLHFYTDRIQPDNLLKTFTGRSLPEQFELSSTTVIVSLVIKDPLMTQRGFSFIFESPAELHLG